MGSIGLSHNAHCVGFKVMALIALIKAVAAITSANCAYMAPVKPGINAAGINTAISTKVMPIMGPVSSRIAAIADSLGGIPRSIC